MVRENDIKPILLKFGVALALSFAGFMYSRFKTKRIGPLNKPHLPNLPQSPRISEHDNEIDLVGGRGGLKYDVYTSQATPSCSRLTSDKHDMDTAPVPEEHSLLTSPQPQATEPDITHSVPSLDLSLELVETASYKPVNEFEETPEPFTNVPPLVPAFYPAYVPVLFPIWPQNFTVSEEKEEKTETCHHHQVLKPIPVIPKEAVNVDELVGMSKLNLEESKHLHKSNSALSLKLLETSRQSAFHANRPASVSDMKDGKSSTIQAAVLIG